MINGREEAYDLLRALGATPHLLRHLQLVGEAGDELILGLQELDVEIDVGFVRLGIAIHDAGKIVHPEELRGPGSEHEPTGEALLLQHGVQPEIARCCLSHARYETMDVRLEELLVALADKLWKGKRVEHLEARVVDAVSERLNCDRWDIFNRLDDCFESIANSGDDRLARSQL